MAKKNKNALNIREMNIILDLDGTLINNNAEPRPFLKEFFEYIFANFDRVSIWTMATGDWFLLIFNNILKPIIPYGKFFSFVWCREHYRINNEGEYIKPLIEVYNAFPWYKENNTVIIDNTPSTFSDNKNNAVFITTFNNNKYDTELLKLITFFKYIFTKLHDEKQKQLNRFIH